MDKHLETLGSMVSHYRRSLNLTSYELADKAGVHQSLISGIQGGSRFCGENNARKIANALGLVGGELHRLIYLALNGSVDRVFLENQRYPAEVLNLVPFALQQRGVAPEAAYQCVLDPTPGGALLYLIDGDKMRIDVTITKC